MTPDLHPLDQLPPLDRDVPAGFGVSVPVSLVYADGSTRTGWHDMSGGWVRTGGKHALHDVDDDPVQPIGWRYL